MAPLVSASLCDTTHLMQLCGSLMQSVLHLKRSQASQPIGGVRASPLSRAWTPPHCRRDTARSSVRRRREHEEEVVEDQDVCKNE